MPLGETHEERAAFPAGGLREDLSIHQVVILLKMQATVQVIRGERSLEEWLVRAWRWEPVFPSSRSFRADDGELAIERES